MDLEVVREPFEDAEEEEYDDSQPPDTRAQPDFDPAFQSSVKTETADLEKDVLGDREEAERTNESDDDDNQSNETTADDIDFARSFGIQLKTKKVISAYNRLINSDQFETFDKPKSTIKTSITSDCIYHKGTFYQKGDIVALYDQDDGQVYFAQLTGFLQDQYCEKSASINWLVPHRPTSRRFFDPSAYRIGMEDARLRKLDCMTFVQHCPHDFYLKKFFYQESSSTSSVADVYESRQTEQSTSQHLGTDLKFSAKGQPPYIWTTMETCEVPKIKTNL